MLTKRQRDLQMEDNNIVIQYYTHLPKLSIGDLIDRTQLYRCNAQMYFTDHVVLLQSYNTIVAAFDIDESTVYDFSRYVYGYTVTTARHVRKFANYMRALQTITYKEVR